MERAPRPRGQSLADRDWLFAIALALAVGVAVWFGRSIRDFFVPPAGSVLTPSLVGQTVNDALAESGRAKLKATVVARQASDRFPKDVVMSQQPPAGAHVREGRQISLIVSNGVQIFAMPDLRYESLRNAGLDLSRLKLALAKTKAVPNDEIQANHIVSQDPPPLSSVREGTAVTLVVSKGPPSAVRVPNFVDMFIDTARFEATAKRIHLGQIVWTPMGRFGPERGRVVRQSPGSGAKIDAFDKVSLQVSAGPREAGYLVRQVHATAVVPASEKNPRVRIEVRDETGTWNVYDAYAEPGQKLDFTLTVIGTAELDTYINNELLNQTRLGVEPPQLKATPEPAALKEKKP